MHAVAGDGERPLHDIAQRIRHVRLYLEADHHAAPALLQSALEQAHQVLRLLLHFDVGVADEAEGALAHDFVAGEEPRDEETDGVLQKQEAQRPRLVALRRHLDEAFQGDGKTHERLHGAALGPDELQRQCEAEIGDERKRMRRVDRQRRQHGKDRIEEIALEPRPLGITERVGRDDDDPRFRQLAAQRPPVDVLLMHQLAELQVDGTKLLGRAQSVGA